MTMAEVDQAAVVEKRLAQREAAGWLGLSVRQVKRLAKRYRECGAAPALRSTHAPRHCGAPAPKTRWPR